MYLHCCNSLRACKTYEMHPKAGYVFSLLQYLDECPVCKNTIVLVKRYGPDFQEERIRKRNEKARKFLSKIRPEIIGEYKPYKELGSSAFALRYNDFGTIKKSYSNLSSLKMGLFDYPGRDLPVIAEKILLT